LPPPRALDPVAFCFLSPAERQACTSSSLLALPTLASASRLEQDKGPTNELLLLLDQKKASSRPALVSRPSLEHSTARLDLLLRRSASLDESLCASRGHGAEVGAERLAMRKKGAAVAAAPAAAAADGLRLNSFFFLSHFLAHLVPLFSIAPPHNNRA